MCGKAFASSLPTMSDLIPSSRPFPASGGECAAILKRMDWSNHPLGEPTDWPPELKTAVRICLTSKFATMVHWGPKHHTFYNDAYAALLGRKHPGHLGQPAYDWWSEMWDQLEPFFQKVLAGESYYTENARYTPDRFGTSKDAFFTHSHSPIWDDAGAVRGIFLTVVETTARIEAEARNELLVGELKHRLKNMLAVVQAIVNQSVRRAASKEDVATIVHAQIAALGRAHVLLTQSSDVEAPLSALVRSSVDVQGSDDRISTDGPEVVINSEAAIALTMILHELKTNALKYGALSNGEGSIAISWRTIDDVLELTWQERGGPAVSPPEQPGFGTRLIVALSRDLGAAPQVDYLSAGIRVTLQAERSKVRMSKPNPASATSCTSTGSEAK